VANEPFVETLTTPIGLWVHRNALPPVDFGGGPAAGTTLVWRFDRNEVSARHGFYREGYRQGVTESPNGFVPADSGLTGNRFSRFQWRVDSTGDGSGRLQLEYGGLGTVPGRQPRVETFRLDYDPASDTLAVRPLDNAWNAGTWVRLTDPTRGFDQVPAGGTGGPYADYRVVSDRDGVVRFEAPVEWSEIAVEPLSNGVGPVLVGAAPPVTAGVPTPGVVAVITDPQLVRHPDAVVRAQVQTRREVGCTVVTEEPFSNPAGLSGTTVLLSACGGTATTVRVVAARTSAGTVLVLIDVQTVAARDAEAADRVLKTLRVGT
jgi:hypothetical protein